MRSTWVWNPCVVITVPFPKRASRVILSKMGQIGHYKKGVSCLDLTRKKHEDI
jgi:hypothetical protein